MLLTRSVSWTALDCALSRQQPTRVALARCGQNIGNRPCAYLPSDPKAMHTAIGVGAKRLLLIRWAVELLESWANALPDFFLDQIPDSVNDTHELRRTFHPKRSRSRDINIDDFLHPPRPGR